MAQNHDLATEQLLLNISLSFGLSHIYFICFAKSTSSTIAISEITGVLIIREILAVNPVLSVLINSVEVEKSVIIFGHPIAIDSNTGNEKYSSDKLVQTYLAAISHSLGDNAGLGCNMGLEHEAMDRKNSFFYTAVIGFSAGEKMGMFLEGYGKKSWFGGAPQTIIPWDIRMDAGMTFLVLPNMQLDLSGGVGLSEFSPKGFISTGISWRIPR